MPSVGNLILCLKPIVSNLKTFGKDDLIEALIYVINNKYSKPNTDTPAFNYK